MSLEQIHIKGIDVITIIGVYDGERVQPQPLKIDIKIDYDAKPAGKSDKISDTLDYCKLTEEIVNKVQQTNFTLVEKLLQYILGIVLENKLAEKAEVEIKKPDALKAFGAVVSVKGQRTRK